MDHYLDIRLRPDPEFALPLLLGALYAKLHRVLAAQQRSDIGASFPGYALAAKTDQGKTVPPTLGDTLRLHGSAAALGSLMAANWLAGMRDHITLGHILPVPAAASPVCVRRKQVKSNPAKERERLMRRKGVSEAEALWLIPDDKAKWLDLPYLTLVSQSTGQRFLFFIAQQAATQAASGEFNAYALSQTATLPAF
ncbi:type I-F CRISPR-associated endoribonuclease Cas6/Csy4 [Laribacter hongkongensis]|uniref:type I-F CRISPR-associated endoribonuclease Cas6/Csy4 n=1 Tax=Laribacter hongkongensis TaxID=168471 RepID=UPI001EFDC189|nr:type I-F CRISPR-associated endoribonuclease Cas6/Csy4 [Laribacter hongkongensis]MCG9124731.1 type I-F CRISPR-associated endoribonuclease Cas6/Csy4 [Laribacter hongkongensis]